MLQHAKRRASKSTSRLFGYGSKLNHQGIAGFGLFYLPGFHFEYLILSHSHLLNLLGGADSAIFPARMMIHMALVSSAPRLCDAFTMVRDLHLEYPQADWSALQHFWKALCAFSYCLVDFSIDALVLRIVYTTAFGHISQRLSRMMSDMKAALLLTVINLPLPVAARTLLMFVFLERIPYDLRPVYALALLLLVLCFFRTSFCRRQ